MAFAFSEADIDRIADVLEVEAKREGPLFRLVVTEPESGRSVSLEIRDNVLLPKGVAHKQFPNLVSVYATNSFLQLQGCTGFIASKELGEVIFFAKRGDVTNGLVVEREAGCSLYANVDDELLNTDYMQLPPELVMSSVALSMSDTLFDDLG
ncbi:MAG: hypothetical protein HKN43_09630 [Rhodothermales bacterium]|nr:hypothetical protein [Rhodothermales bacterium]